MSFSPVAVRSADSAMFQKKDRWSEVRYQLLMRGWEGFISLAVFQFCHYLKKMGRAGFDPSHSITPSARLIISITSIYTLSTGETIN